MDIYKLCFYRIRLTPKSPEGDLSVFKFIGY